ncbi:MAG: PASTA domain-containing protein [Chlorobi bacterium]|nr:PASTA domain-containing protein [Chlorobiota bacterium]
MGSEKKRGIVNAFKYLMKHIFAMIFIAVLLFIVLNLFLKSYTRHGVAIIVPNVKGLPVDSAIAVLTTNQLRYKVIDSSYVDTLPGGIVIKQNPEEGKEVKPERTIYLTISAYEAPKVRMPDLIDMPLQTAQSILETNNLKIKEIIYKPDIANNVVLEQIYKGKPIAPGTLIPINSEITLVVGIHETGRTVTVPNVKCKTLMEALTTLQLYGLSQGSIVADKPIVDSSRVFVVKQDPPAGESKPLGSPVDIFISETLPPECNNVYILP